MEFNLTDSKTAISLFRNNTISFVTLPKLSFFSGNKESHLNQEKVKSEHFSLETDSIYVRNISLLSRNKYFLMYLRGQMNLSVFLNSQILQMNERFSIKTFDSIQFLGLNKGPEEVEIKDFKNVSLMAKQRSKGEPREGTTLMFGKREY
jgi:hypothetical protein